MPSSSRMIQELSFDTNPATRTVTVEHVQGPSHDNNISCSRDSRQQHQELSSVSNSRELAQYQERLAAYKATWDHSPGPGPGPGPAQQSCSKLKKKVSLTPDEARLVPLLALQCYHLPGNTWWQDWWQYMANNHPVFGICCHHRLHPIGACTRTIALIGTILFGLAMTNMFYLFYLWNPRFNQVIVTVSTAGREWTLTTGMLLLWTVGGSLHTLFNLLVWHIAACACCRSGGCCESLACCPSLGKRLVRVFVLMMLMWTALIVLFRVAISHADNDTIDDHEDDYLVSVLPEEDWEFQVNNAQEFHFLIGYLVEMVLTLFIYYPLGGTILFSGALGCIPLLGGRPAEVAAEEKRQTTRQIRQTRTGSTTLASTAAVDPPREEENAANQDVIELAFDARAVREWEERV